MVQFSGEVQASGGFQITIPDGEQIGIDIDVDIIDAMSDNFGVSASINILYVSSSPAPP